MSTPAWIQNAKRAVDDNERQVNAQIERENFIKACKERDYDTRCAAALAVVLKGLGIKANVTTRVVEVDGYCFEMENPWFRYASISEAPDTTADPTLIISKLPPLDMNPEYEGWKRPESDLFANGRFRKVPHDFDGLILMLGYALMDIERDYEEQMKRYQLWLLLIAAGRHD